MEIVYTLPPNYEDIASTFDIKEKKNVVFTYGNKLYVPGGRQVMLDRALMKHEEVHARQQKKVGIKDWWDRFLIDPAFRLQQEMEAYREQYRNMAGLPLKHRVGYLDHISKDLSGPMYGNLLTVEQAKEEITRGIILKHTKPSSASDIVRKLKKRQRLNRKKGRK